MSLEAWGWEIFQHDEEMTGSGRITVGKSHKGEDHEIRLLLNERVLYRLQQLFDLLMSEPGEPKAKRAVDQIAEHFRERIARSRREEYEEEVSKQVSVKVEHLKSMAERKGKHSQKAVRGLATPSANA